MAYYYSPFRKAYGQEPRTGCVFCSDAIISQTIRTPDGLAETENYRWVINLYPKFEGHTMLVPKRHITKPGTETNEEVMDREKLLRLAAETLEKVFPGSGVEVFLQTGGGSESTIPHLHWHVVPASPDDPLRSFEKLGHFYTIEPGAERVVIFPIPITRSPEMLLDELSGATTTRER